MLAKRLLKYSVAAADTGIIAEQGFYGLLRRTAIVRRRLAVFGLALAAVTSASGLVAAPTTAAVGDCVPSATWGTIDRALAAQVVQLVNAHRTAMGLGMLSASSSLTASAEWKSLHMGAYNYLAHDDPAPPISRTVAQRLDACGYPSGSAGWGENIAYYYPDAVSVMNAWLSDSGHKANLESPYWTTIGVGVARNHSGQLYWTQDFGTTGVSAPVLPPSSPSDPKAPSVPSGFRVSALSGTTLSVSWQPSTDNVGVAGYDVYANGGLLGQTGSTAGTIGGFACGTSYTVGVDAYDSAGNRSAAASAVAATLACSPESAPASQAPTPQPSGEGPIGGTSSGGGSSGDAPLGPTNPAAASTSVPSPSSSLSPQTGAGGSTVLTGHSSDSQAPAAPSNVRVLGGTRTTVRLRWQADTVGGVFYRVFRDGLARTTVKATVATITGLACGRTHTIEITALDAAGHESAPLTVRLRKRACSRL